ncbi:MAG TPA: class I SAM-dependent rRNA methyltransferase, partial [Pseudobdellovibrionaceae bacterium]|nr:class I SAM-dependent rRNA methyltransferase [Pseudobdellovibrionaceae bacterium]
MLKIQIKRNLRRTLMRGHPWVYRDALEKNPTVEQAQLCQVLDSKNEALGWAMYDPHSPLALRIMSLDAKPPNWLFFEKKFEQTFNLRKAFIKNDTDSFRLFNGEGDRLPGMICDVYGSIAVLQFDGKGPREFWDKNKISEWILKNTPLLSVVEKVRKPTEEKILQQLGGKPVNPEIQIQENQVRFHVDLENGQKTGFFLDQRENRKYVQDCSHGKSVLNLFSYSGGFSVYAGLGGATQVASCDISAGAIILANANWALNNLPPETHRGLCVDIFDFLKTDRELWDCVIVDPPSMSHSEDQKARAQAKYIEIFALAAKKVKPQGHLFLSSCSSHISFDDFFEIINESLSESRRRGQILRVSG